MSARAVPVKIDKIDVKLDFHIYLLIDFELLIGYPLENLLQKNLHKGASTMIPGKLLSPLLSLARKSQWRNIISTITLKKR